MAKSKTASDIPRVTFNGQRNIVLPRNMPVGAAIQLLRQHDATAQAGEQFVRLRERIDCYPFDGALAMLAAMRHRFGREVQREGFFDPATQISVPTSTGSVLVPFGNFTVPGLEGQISFEASETGALVLEVSAYVKKKDEETIRQLVADARRRVKEVSIYSGQAFKIRFRDEGGDFDVDQKPEFLSLQRAVQPIYDAEVEAQIRMNLLTPILHWQEAVKAGLPRRRVALAYGPYGTGKTLLGYWIAQQAVAKGWTFLYVVDVKELPEALELARQYSPCVIFAEDVDLAVGGVRNDSMNEFFNSLGGLDSDDADLFIIFTTNHLERIHPAMRRAGRIDCFVNINHPKPETIERLIRQYGKRLIKPQVKLTEVATVLTGLTASDIREVVEQAKLAAISRNEGTMPRYLMESDLLVTAQGYAAMKQVLAETIDEAVFTKHPLAALLSQMPGSGRLALIG